MSKKVIWKYEIPDCTVVTLAMPGVPQVLSVQLQMGKPVMWALVDPEMPMRKHTFHVVGTGWDFNPDHLAYIGTFQVDDGLLVFHLFVETTIKSSG